MTAFQIVFYWLLLTIGAVHTVLHPERATAVGLLLLGGVASALAVHHLQRGRARRQIDQEIHRIDQQAQVMRVQQYVEQIQMLEAQTTQAAYALGVRQERNRMLRDHYDTIVRREPEKPWVEPEASDRAGMPTLEFIEVLDRILVEA